jgi:hypothetical protein
MTEGLEPWFSLWLLPEALIRYTKDLDVVVDSEVFGVEKAPILRDRKMT